MKVSTLEALEQRLEGTSKRLRRQNLSLQRVPGKKRTESSIPGVGEWRRKCFSSGQGCRHQGHSIKGGRAVQSGAAESQRQAIPALPILVTAAVGKITALTAVIPYKKRDM